MSLCINPNCAQPDHPGNDGNRQCQSCGSDLILQQRYRVMRLLSNRTGFGRVYEAYERNSPKILKVLKPAHNHNAKAVQLFQQEAYVLGQLDHPGVPAVEGEGYFQFHPADGGELLHCLVMEKIDGPNLREWMRQQGSHPISEKQAREWMWQVADVLHLVHQQHYFHRDIKPENVMLRSNGQVVLVDFGAARAVTETYMAQLGATEGMTRISSAGYTPPEQEKGQAVPQSDFFALGWTFIYLLTGKQPTDVEVYNPLTDTAHWREFAPQITPEFGDFIDCLIAPRAVDRPQTTTALLNALNNLPDLPTHLPGVPPPRAVNGSTDVTEPLYGGEISGPPLTSLPFWKPKPPDQGRTGTPSTEPTWPGKDEPLDPPFEPTGPHWNRWSLWGAGLLTLLLASGGVSWWLSQQTIQPGSSVISILQQLASSYGTTVRSLQPQQELRGHSSFVNHVLFTPDGNGVISAGADRQIILWNQVTGQPTEALTNGHQGFINVLALNGSGQWLVSGGADNRVVIWDLTTGQPVHRLTGHTSPVNALAITPDGILASGSADRTVRTWNLETGAPLLTLTGHEGFINGIAISPDGKTLAAVGAAPEVVIWDLHSGQEIRRLGGYDGNLNTVLFSPDGSRLLAAGTGHTVYIWNVQTGQLERSLADHTGYVNNLAIRGDGNRLLSSDSDGKLYLWSLENGVLIQAWQGDGAPLDYFTMSSDWHRIATGRGTPTVYLWETPAIAIH